MTTHIYDIEVYPNFFSYACVSSENYKARWYYEISSRQNNLTEFIGYLHSLKSSAGEMVGFNNLSYDYPVIHYMLGNYHLWYNLGSSEINKAIYLKSKSIINSDNKYKDVVFNPYIPQIDLYKINHFDNRARATSLKSLQFSMLSFNIQELPFAPDECLSHDQMKVIAQYNMHDVTETFKFYDHCKTMVTFRKNLSDKIGFNFINHSDTRLGQDYMVMKLKEFGIDCHVKNPYGRKIPKQTHYPNGFCLGDVIFDYIKFENPKFDNVKDKLKIVQLNPFKHKKGIDTKGILNNVNCEIDGLTYNFGLGGLHASLQGSAIHSTDETAIIDLDIASYYPNLAIANKLYPKHLGREFCDVYLDIYKERKKYAKNTEENQGIKKALNSVYGKSNDVWSPFYDTAYTMATTINGQLILCMLIEKLITLSSVKIIQVNTDGLTVSINRNLISWMNKVVKEWENFTKLSMEQVEYKDMYIRDVNNYIGVYTDGRMKLKGAYEKNLPQHRVPTGWHQDTGGLIIPKCAVYCLTEKVDVEEYIRGPNHSVFDFSLRAKVNRNTKLLWGEEEQQRLTRYVVTKKGKQLVKLMPALKNKQLDMFDKMTQYRRIAVQKGWNVTVCNNIRDMDGLEPDYDFYIGEVKKLTECIKDL